MREYTCAHKCWNIHTFNSIYLYTANTVKCIVCTVEILNRIWTFFELECNTGNINCTLIVLKSFFKWKWWFWNFLMLRSHYACYKDYHKWHIRGENSVTDRFIVSLCFYCGEKKVFSLQLRNVFWNSYLIHLHKKMNPLSLVFLATK